MKCLQKLGMWRAPKGGVLKLCWSNIVHHWPVTIYLSPVEIDRLITEHTTKNPTLLTLPIPFTYLILSTYSLRTPSNIFWKKQSLQKYQGICRIFITVATYLSEYILWIILRSDQTQNSTNLNFSLAPVCQPTGKGGWGVLAALCLLCHLQQHRAVGTRGQGGNCHLRFLQNS